MERAGERLVDFTDPRGEALLEPGLESWTDQYTEFKPILQASVRQITRIKKRARR